MIDILEPLLLLLLPSVYQRVDGGGYGYVRATRNLSEKGGTIFSRYKIIREDFELTLVQATCGTMAIPSSEIQPRISS